MEIVVIIVVVLFFVAVVAGIAIARNWRNVETERVARFSVS